MKRIRIPGQKAPAFVLPDQDGQEHSLGDFLGQWVALYFYPKDDTPGCTAEACSFRDGYAALKRQGVVVLGVSADPVKKHKRFAEKYSLPFPLLADEEKKVVEAYGVWGKKRFMGREYMGITRTTFLIDPEGRIAKIYEQVDPDGHANEILADVKALKKGRA
jgi:peroxiredoxin Q/BCP